MYVYVDGSHLLGIFVYIHVQVYIFITRFLSHPLIPLSPHFFHTAILLAYFGGSTVLCDALIKAGSHPGMSNKQGISIFNTPVATKQLMFRILDKIHTEPTWLDSNFCQNCGIKFNISHRKHHW